MHEGKRLFKGGGTDRPQPQPNKSARKGNLRLMDSGPAACYNAGKIAELREAAGWHSVQIYSICAGRMAA